MTLIAAVVAAATLTLAGCTAEGRQLATTVTWPDGEAAGPLDEEPAVQAVREFETVFAAAWNAADFSGELVRAAMADPLAADGADRLAEYLEADAAAPMLSPNGVMPLEIGEPDADGVVGVVACATHVASPFIGGGVGGTYRVSGRWYGVQQHEDGLRVVRNRPQGTVDCTGVTVPLAVFDPAPDPAAWTKLTADDVRGP